MHIGQVLDTVFDDYVGWRPASGALKPVHVANGLLRSLCGEVADVQRLHEFLVWWQKGKVPDDARTFEALMAADADDVYAGFKDHPTQLFEQTRTYALGLLGGDRALFPARDSSSFSLTCKQMITRDYNDRHIGDFIAQVILGETDLAEIIRGYADVTRPQDPITALAWPLLRGQPRKVEGARRHRVKQPRSHQEYITQMRAAAECLATHERRQGNHLRALQRVVQFGAVAVLAHAQALAAGGRLERRTPLLVAMSASRQSDIALASERSLDLTVRAFERWLGEKLSERIAAGEPLAPEENPLSVTSTNPKSVRAILARIGVAEKGHADPSDELIEGRMATYRRILEERESPAEVLAHTLVDCYGRENKSGGPHPFLVGLARKVGLAYPHKQGAARNKRIRPTVLVLDMLVRACVPAGDSVSIDVFLERLWQRFGLVVGGRRSEEHDDGETLVRAGISLDYQDLVGNTEALVDELTAMGLARRYPDAVAFVGDGAL